MRVTSICMRIKVKLNLSLINLAEGYFRFKYLKKKMNISWKNTTFSPHFLFLDECEPRQFVWESKWNWIWARCRSNGIDGKDDKGCQGWSPQLNLYSGKDLWIYEQNTQFAKCIHSRGDSKTLIAVLIPNIFLLFIKVFFYAYKSWEIWNIFHVYVVNSVNSGLCFFWALLKPVKVWNLSKNAHF